VRARPVAIDRFLEVAGRFPDSVAIEGAESITFGELRRRVAGLGGALRRAGVGPGVVVGLALPPSDHIVAMLAVWWAGGAFLPLDPAWPAARAALVCQDAGLRLAISRRPLDLPGVLHPEEAAEAPGFPGELHDELAYVIYTSGSTGQPKGVRVAHRGLLPVLDAQIEAFRLGPGKRALLFLSTAFDASISDIGTALLSGATLCLPPRPASPAQLAAWISGQRITHADLPPSLLPLLGEPPAGLEVVVIGGEVCPPEVVRAWARRLRIVNVYGPTEATICTSMVACDAGSWSRPLLGDPLPHVRYRVVAEDRTETPPGGRGELWIGGEALALGYVDNEALDRARFVQDGPDRWYRTGDLVVLHPDGAIEFLGRLDRQRKLRGQLVAPEEVEACVRAFPGVQDAAVVVRPLARPGRPPREALVAFVVAPHARERAPLAAHLRRHLPGFLRPALLLVDALPRGTTGKADLAALTRDPLPRPAGAGPSGGTASRTETLGRLFADTLGLPEVGADEDFFDLGGDSFAAIELIAAAAAIGLDLPADALHEAPTPRALASVGGSAPGRSTAELRREVEAILSIEDPGGAAGSEARSSPARPIMARVSPLSRELLLTGATGFLGSRLLVELLARGETVACLVRARDEEDGRQRLALALAQQGHEGPLGRRVRVVPGDIEARQFGLDDAAYDRLCTRTDRVIHSAAAVSHALPYGALRGPNVQGTATVLALTRRACPGRLYQVSTLSVLVATDLEETCFSEASDPERATMVLGGYAQSKWAAEHLLRQRGPFVCLRPGLLTGDSVTGRPAPRCQLAWFIQGIAALGCLPAGDHDRLRFDVTPVDVAARALAAIVGKNPPSGVFHVASRRGASLADLLAALAAEGRPCATVSPERFRQRSRENLPFPAAMTLLSATSRLLGGQAHGEVDLFQLTGRELSCEVTERASGVAVGEPDAALLRRYVRAALAPGHEWDS
jgi:amino acid adenylation domain-containing protein/thioester reductase-like protein